MSSHINEQQSSPPVGGYISLCSLYLFDMFTRTHDSVETYVNSVGDYFRVIDNSDCGTFDEVNLLSLGPIEDYQDDCPF